MGSRSNQLEGQKKTTTRDLKMEFYNFNLNVHIRSNEPDGHLFILFVAPWPVARQCHQIVIESCFSFVKNVMAVGRSLTTFDTPLMRFFFLFLFQTFISETTGKQYC